VLLIASLYKYLFLAVLVFELRASPFLGRCSTVAERQGGRREIMSAIVKQRQIGVEESHLETREGSPCPRG
jgi:hypothetical protein